MRICADNNVGLREVSSYIEHFTGAPLILGIDAAEDYVQVLGFLTGDQDKTILRVSDSCTGEFPPNPNLLVGKVSDAAKTSTVVWLGASQAVMLNSQKATEDFLIALAGMNFSRPVIVLCPYLCSVLEAIGNRYAKLGHWFVLIPSPNKSVPSIRLYAEKGICPEAKPLIGMKALMRLLENGTTARKLALVSTCREAWLTASMFPLSKGISVYEMLCEREPGIKAFTQETDGSQTQWGDLAKALKGVPFAEYCAQKLGSIGQLPQSFGEAIADPDNRFLCYIALKVFCSSERNYLSECLKRCGGADDLEKRLYDTILSFPVSATQYKLWIRERRRLLQSLDENHALMQDYCDRATIYGRDILFALTDSTEEERAAIIHAICTYNYPADELQGILCENAPQLALYLRGFVFDTFNTKVLESDSYIRTLLTDYFCRYKLQKLSNRIDPEFMSIVEDEAVKRSFTRLQVRAGIVKKMDKEGAIPIFFDALGAEYLAYIEAKCEEYDMQFDCQIAHCNLPSITCFNKEFYSAFPEDSIRKEPGLDDIKHEGTLYDYQLTKEPLHIFDELTLLDKSLKKFSSWLRAGTCQKVIMLSDHGASRLAVIRESENEKLELAEKGKHSGRCCPCDHDPEIPFAYYDPGTGFAVLANYERFKGSRKADVETHGGATLEETIVPIITLTAKPKEQQIFFPNDTVQCSAKDGSRISLYANPPLKKPRMVIRGISYLGTFEGDKHNVLFAMPDIKRKGHYEAEVFDGSKKIETLAFDAVRSTKINDDF